MTVGDTGHDGASSEGTVTVTEAGSGTYTQQITLGRHRLVADEPRPIGDDAGPTPYDLLLAALGACTSMTLRMYADRKGWPLKEVRVALRHSRIHAEDCASCETTKGWVDHIDRDIELTGELEGVNGNGYCRSRIVAPFIRPSPRRSTSLRPCGDGPLSSVATPSRSPAALVDWTQRGELKWPTAGVSSRLALNA
jgi:uncharacterized OsmC-like protein